MVYAMLHYCPYFVLLYHQADKETPAIDNIDCHRHLCNRIYSPTTSNIDYLRYQYRHDGAVLFPFWLSIQEIRRPSTTLSHIAWLCVSHLLYHRGMGHLPWR